MSKDLDQIVEDAKEELLDTLVNYGDWPRYPQDKITEIADSSTPIMTSDILDLGARNWELSTAVPEIGPAFDGKPTPVNIIAANIYEHIERELGDYLRELEELREEYLYDAEEAWSRFFKPDGGFYEHEDGFWKPARVFDFELRASLREAVEDLDIDKGEYPLTTDEIIDLLVEAAEERLEEEEEEDG